MSRNQIRIGRQPRRGRSPGIAGHPVIDNRKYPSTDEVAKFLNVPADRVRQLKELATKMANPAQIAP
jgi:hypothetical protein